MILVSPVLPALTVDGAVRIALDNNLSLRQIALNTGTAKRAADRSWNTLLPTLNTQALLSHPTSITGPIEPASRDVWTPGFSLSAGFTFSASIADNIKKARIDYESGLLSYEAAKQELELQVRKLFYQILLLDANLELARQNFTSAQGRYEQSAALTRAGQAPQLDELSARVDMENLRPIVRNAETLYGNALDTLKLILGLPMETVVKLDGALSPGFTFQLSVVELGSGASLEAEILRKNIQSMEAQKRAARNGAYSPSLMFSWTSTPLYSRQNSNWNDNGSFSISLGLSIDKFLPWSGTKTQIDTLTDNIRAAEIQLTDTLRNRENRINQNARTVESILESLEAIKLNVELAQSTYEMALDAYKRGAADYQRLRSAGDGLEQAKNRLLQEHYNLISALLDLEKELNIPFGTLSSEQLVNN